MTLLLFLTSGGGPKYVDATCVAAGDLSAVAESRASVKPYAECNVFSAGAAVSTDVTSLVPAAAAAAVSSVAADASKSAPANAVAAVTGDVSALLYTSTFTATAIASENGGLLFLPTKPNRFAVCDIVADSVVTPGAERRAPLLPLPLFPGTSSAEPAAQLVTAQQLYALCQAVASFAVSIPPRSEAAPAGAGAGRVGVGGTSGGGGRASAGSVSSGVSRETSGSFSAGSGRNAAGSATSGSGRS